MASKEEALPPPYYPKHNRDVDKLRKVLEEQHKNRQMTNYYGHDILKKVDAALTPKPGIRGATTILDDGPVPMVSYQAKRIVHIITPTGPLTVIRPVAERLLQEHVISGSLDGELHCTDAAILKSAVMATGVCDFCSLVGATHIFEVPDFDMPVGAGRSVGGWLACDDCDVLIRANRRKDLLKRSLDKLAFPKFSRTAVEELFNKFWQGMEEKADVTGVAAAFGDYINDTLPDMPPASKRAPRDARLDSVAHITGLTRKQAQALSLGDIDTETLGKLATFNKRLGVRGKVDALRALLPEGPHKPLADVMPHWQKALDGQFEAMTHLDTLLRSTKPRSQYFPEATDLNDPAAVKALIEQASHNGALKDLGFHEDLKALRVAQAYSFNAETIAAIREAAQSIPHDAPLSSIETPNTGAGWFWFAEPLDKVCSSVASDKTQALLWCWSNGLEVKGPEPAIMFSPYVVDELGKVNQGRILPSTRWYWPLSMSFHDMMAYNTVRYREFYGPGAKFEHDTNRMGEEATMACIAELSLFFIMSCLWFKQTVPSTAPILTKAPGHIERHARKRFVRDHNLKEPPTVQVVALRKTMRIPVEQAEGERSTTAREYHCRWIVAGHPRLQPCGPGRKDRKLIWVDAYPKGPEDKPLRTRKKVFAVVR